MSAIFQPTLLDWLFGSGIGTNLGASLIWIVPSFAAGFVTGRKLWTHVKLHHLRQNQHAEWMANQMKRLHEREGIDAEPHPFFELKDTN
jgi:hypothetical protein